MTHDAWVLRPLGVAVLIDIAIVGCGDACILLRFARLHFCGKLINQRLDRLKSRVGIGILRIEIRDNMRVVAIAQPVVIIDAYTAECFECLWYDRRNRRAAPRSLDCVGQAEWQSVCERNPADSRETKRQAPSSEMPAHPYPRAAANSGRMRRLTGAVWAQAWFKLAHSGGFDRTTVC